MAEIDALTTAMNKRLDRIDAKLDLLLRGRIVEVPIYATYRTKRVEAVLHLHNPPNYLQDVIQYNGKDLPRCLRPRSQCNQ